MSKGFGHLSQFKFAGGWSPKDLTGLLMWVDADNPGSGVGDGDAVTSFPDQSGNSNNFLTRSKDPSEDPVFRASANGSGTPGLEFTRNHALDGPVIALGSNTGAIISVSTSSGPPAGASGEFIVGRQFTTDGIEFKQPSSGNYRVRGRTNGISSDTYTATDFTGAPLVCITGKDGVNSRIVINAATYGITANAANWSHDDKFWQLGANGGTVIGGKFGGWLHAAMLMSEFPTADEQTAIWDYFSEKYGAASW